MRLLEKPDYEAMARLRYVLRKFLRFTEDRASAVGLTPQQYQALLAIRGFPDRDYATVGELADRLQIRHHTSVELINRLETAALVRRQSIDHDRRLVRVYLTKKGDALLTQLCALHDTEWLEIAKELHTELGAFVVR